MPQNKTTLILCSHPSAIERDCPNTSRDKFIECNECGVCYRITYGVIRFYFEPGRLSDDQRNALLKYIKSEYPKLQKSALPAPTPIFVDTDLIKYIISRTSDSS